jgi:hypothetical protein
MPFSAAEFLDVFRHYNEAVWPAQWVLAIAALAVIVAALRARDHGGRTPLLFLAVLWAWMAVAYHLLFFRDINPLADGFAAVFMLQAILLGHAAIQDPAPVPRPRRPLAAGAGALLMVYALVVYPALGYLLGHRYPESPTFGLPCPTTIFTFGMLVWFGPAISLRLVVIPCVWALVGTIAALQLGMWEDFGLSAAAVVAVGALLVSRRRSGGMHQWALHSS